MSTEYTEYQKSTKDVAADQASGVAEQTKATAADVAGTAKEQGQALLSETQYHARTLLDQARTELTEQAGMQQLRAGEVLRTFATELQDMAGASAQGSGIAAGLVGDVATRAEGVARRLEEASPEELLADVRRFARRNPGTFLATAAVVGFLGGRLTRSLTAHDDEPRAAVAPRPARPVAGTYQDAAYEGVPYATGTTDTTYATGTAYPATHTTDAAYGVQGGTYATDATYTTGTSYAQGTDAAFGTDVTYGTRSADAPFDQQADSVRYVEEPGVVRFDDEPGAGAR